MFQAKRPTKRFKVSVGWSDGSSKLLSDSNTTTAQGRGSPIKSAAVWLEWLLTRIFEVSKLTPWFGLVKYRHVCYLLTYLPRYVRCTYVCYLKRSEKWARVLFFQGPKWSRNFTENFACMKLNMLPSPGPRGTEYRWWMCQHLSLSKSERNYL